MLDSTKGQVPLLKGTDSRICMLHSVVVRSEDLLESPAVWSWKCFGVCWWAWRKQLAWVGHDHVVHPVDAAACKKAWTGHRVLHKESKGAYNMHFSIDICIVVRWYWCDTFLIPVSHLVKWVWAPCRVDDLSLLVKTRQTKRKVVQENWEIIAGESLLRAIIAKSVGKGLRMGLCGFGASNLGLGAHFL